MKMENFDEQEKKVNVSNIKEDESLSYTDIEDLPSRYKLYSKGVMIKGRPLKLFELKKLSTMTELNSDTVINDVLKSSLKGINIDDVIVADKLYLIFWLRANTYREPGYSVNFHCSNCKQDSSYDFNLNNLKVKYVDESFTLEKLTFSLTNGDTISFHIPKVSDEKRTIKFKNTYASIIKDISNDIFDMSIVIDQINGENLELMDKYDYISNLTPQLFSQLKSKIKKWDFGIMTDLEVICNKCGGKIPVGITFREEFFIPEYNDE
jgi:hypothetical protein